MADDVSGPPQTTDDEALVVARRRVAEPAPGRRFAIAYLALAGLLGAAIGAAVVLAANGGSGKQPPWSAWKPTKSGVQRLDEIAKYVSRAYALPTGDDLAGAVERPPVLEEQGQSVPVRTIGVSTGLAGETAGDLNYYDASTAWTFQLCGLGPNCTLLGGTPSTEKGQLLRREALELALYTFKYNGDIDSLLTFMPPSDKTNPSKVVLFFRRSDLRRPLDLPLDKTLPRPQAPLVPGQMSTGDLLAVEDLADPHVYDYDFGQTSLGTAIIVLKPPTG